MFSEPTVGKITKYLTRGDGSEVRIIAQAFTGSGLHQSVNVMVHRRASPTDEWDYCSDQPHPDWRRMRVAEYIKRGRSPMLQTVTIGELLMVTRLIGKPIAALSPAEVAIVTH